MARQPLAGGSRVAELLGGASSDMLRRACRRLLFLRQCSGAQTFCHVLSGLNCFIALAMAAPFGPRFFWYTTPS